MKKLVRCGLLLLAVSVIGVSLLALSGQAVYATEEADPELTEESTEALTEEEIFTDEKAAAIHAANEAIRRIADPDLIIAYEEKFVQDVAKAISLVEHARKEYGATDNDFENLAKLDKAEKKVVQFLVIQEFKDAVDKIPPLEKITEDDRAIIEEARRLGTVAIEEHQATIFQLCWRYYYLLDAEDRLPEEVEPEPEPEPEPVPKPDDRLPTPPTGGLTGVVGIGLLLSGAGYLFIRKQRGRN